MCKVYHTEYAACDHVVQMKYEKCPKYNARKKDTSLIKYDYEEDDGYCEECREENEGKENDEGKSYAAKNYSEKRKRT